MTHAVRDTSVEAYDYCRALGITGKQQFFIACYLYFIPAPRTRAEIARDTGIAINAVCGRVRELLDAGTLLEHDARPCTVSGRRAHPVSLAIAPYQPALL